MFVFFYVVFVVGHSRLHTSSAWLLFGWFVRSGKIGSPVVMMTEVPATPLEELLSVILAVSLSAPPRWKGKRTWVPLASSGLPSLPK